MRLSTGALIVLCCAAQACTSFVDYSCGAAWYGMNFDWYPEQDILFRLESDSRGGTVFTMSFMSDGNPVPTVGFTADGRFSTMQVIDAPWTGPSAGSDNPLIFIPFYAMIYNGATVADIQDMAVAAPFRQYDDPPLHVLVADATGSASVIEVGENGNRVLDLAGGDVLVMTNFSNCEWQGADPMQIRGVGADRFRAAHAALEACEGVMGPAAGMAVLEAAVNTTDAFPTRASMVFDPSEGHVYIAVAGDFEKLWSLDLSTRELSPWPGSGGDEHMTVDSTGVTASSLSGR